MSSASIRWRLEERIRRGLADLYRERADVEDGAVNGCLAAVDLDLVHRRPGFCGVFGFNRFLLYSALARILAHASGCRLAGPKPCVTSFRNCCSAKPRFVAAGSLNSERVAETAINWVLGRLRRFI